MSDKVIAEMSKHLATTVQLLAEVANKAEPNSGSIDALLSAVQAAVAGVEVAIIHIVSIEARLKVLEEKQPQ